MDRKSHSFTIGYDSTAAITNISFEQFNISHSNNTNIEENDLTKDFLHALYQTETNSMVLSLTDHGVNFFSRLLNVVCNNLS